MTDIISRAQELVELRASMDKSILREALEVTYEESRFVPALTEALAEETYQYGIEIFDHGGWEHQANVSGEPVWDEEKSYTEDALDYFIQNGFTARIVRRRVSPVEVVNG